MVLRALIATGKGKVELDMILPNGESKSVFSNAETFL